MKKLVFSLFFGIAGAGVVSSQLKVHSDGDVSVGTLTSFSTYALTVDGYEAIAVTNGSNFMRFSAAVNNSVIGGNINDKVAFWDNTFGGYHTLDAQSFHVTSDSSLKTRVTPLTDISALEKMKTYSYYFKDEVGTKRERLHFGFLAQEMQQILPNLVDSGMDVLLMNYDEIIPLLVNGYQNQQTIIQQQTDQISTLQEEVDQLKAAVHALSNHTGMDLNPDLKPIAVLYQNAPNPFKETTTIKYELPEHYSTASIMVFNMNGTLLETYDITGNRNSNLVIEGGKFKAGMYLYSLIVDGNAIDTKKMILNK